MKNKIPATVGILTFNNISTIQKALESAKDFEHIVICDGGSNDGTLEVAKKYKVEILFQDNRFKNKKGELIDYSGPRNQMLKKARFDWFLFLDSDEELSKELVKNISNVIESNIKNTVYRVHRRFVYGGKVVKCSIAYPNYQERLFRISEVYKFVKPIHERIDYPNTIKNKELKGYLYVPLDIKAEDLKKKWKRYLYLQSNFLIKSNTHRVLYSFLDLIKYSLVYGFRFIKCRIFNREPKLPVSLEMVWFWLLFYTLKLNIKRLLKNKK